MNEPTAAEVGALARALQKHDPEPYFPSNWEDKAYYREYAAAILASGLRVILPAKGGRPVIFYGTTPEPVSRVQAIEAAEDHADQTAFDAWRERGL